MNNFDQCYNINGDEYHWIGTKLFGPNNQKWDGIDNEDDIMNIIFSETHND